MSLAPGRKEKPDRDLAFSAYLGLAALLPRLYIAIAWPREPVWDGHYYDFGARRIAAGFGYSDGIGGFHPWCHWPVGYSGVLAAMYKLFGGGPHVATVFNAVTGALLAVFTHRLSRYELSRWRARTAGLACAFYPGLIVYAALLMTEALSALILVVAGWLWVRHRDDRPGWAAVLFGLAIGCGTLVHPSFIAYAPALVVLGGQGAMSLPNIPVLRRSVAAATIATACAFLPVLPWTIRNCRVMDRCTLVSTNGGWNLAIGSFPRATGRFETLRATDGCAVVTGQVQQDACWRDLAVATIRKDPERWLGLVPKKLAYTFDHESFAIEYLHEADPDRWSEDRRRKGRGLLTGAHRALLTLAAFGVVPCLGRSRNAVSLAVASTCAIAALSLFVWSSDSSPFYLLAVAVAVLGWLFDTFISFLPISSPGKDGGAADGGAPGAAAPSEAWGPVTRWALFCVAGTLLTHAVFFGEDRYHIVVTPMLCFLAARAFSRHAERTFNVPHLHDKPIALHEN